MIFQAFLSPSRPDEQKGSSQDGVVPRRLRADWGPVEVFGNPGAAIADLKAREDDGTILIHGGPTFAKSVVRLGLVDEYQLSWVPVAIGAGLSPFADLGQHLKLDLVQEQRFASGAHGQILVPHS